NRYNGPGNGDDYANAVRVDGRGNVFVTGYSLGSGGSYDYATIAYSSAGALFWTNRYNGSANRDDRPGSGTCLGLGPDGSVYVTGGSSAGTTYDYATIKYSLRPQLTIEQDGNGGYFLRFEGVPGSSYRLQRATTLTGPWTTSAPL